MVATVFKFFLKLPSVCEVDFLSEPKFNSVSMHSPMQTRAMETRVRIFFFDRNRQIRFFIDNLDSLVQGSLRFILASGFSYQVKDTLPQTFIKVDK